jgi:hypothetical protein
VLQIARRTLTIINYVLTLKFCVSEPIRFRPTQAHSKRSRSFPDVACRCIFLLVSKRASERCRRLEGTRRAGAAGQPLLCVLIAESPREPQRGQIGPARTSF